MFTGLIETVGTLSESRQRGNYRVLRISTPAPLEDVKLGESIACDGACLTVVSFDKQSFVVEASQESLRRSILADYLVGRRINLERALQMGGRLGGHLVSGHVDTVGAVDYMKQVGESWELAIRYEADYDPLVVGKGSIAINGISLTVNQCAQGWFAVNVIPLTYRETNVADLTAGGKVNLEFDLIGKYILKQTKSDKPSGLDMNKLLESGW